MRMKLHHTIATIPAASQDHLSAGSALGNRARLYFHKIKGCNKDHRPLFILQPLFHCYLRSIRSVEGSATNCPSYSCNVTIAVWRGVGWPAL